MEKNSRKKFIMASVAGLLAAGSVAATSVNAQAMESPAGTVPCYGINACKGTGDCGGKGYSCAGKNACKGQGFIKLPADACTRIECGKLSA